jgi:hypothetical protein
MNLGRKPTMTFTRAKIAEKVSKEYGWSLKQSTEYIE